MTSSQRCKYKVVLLGEGRVGKTSILLRYIRNTFDEAQISTTKANFFEKHLTIGSNSIDLIIWDTAGQERFHSLGPIYYRDANGAILVYDISDGESFSKVRQWVKELRKMVGPDIQLTLVGNKLDLEEHRQVDDAEVESYAKSIGATHLKASAKSGKGVEMVFLQLCKDMLASQPVSSTQSSSRNMGVGVDLSGNDNIQGEWCQGC